MISLKSTPLQKCFSLPSWCAVSRRSSALKLANIENARLDHVTRDLLGELLTANR